VKPTAEDPFPSFRRRLDHGDTPGLTNSVDFIEIRRIQSPPNFKTSDLTVHGVGIFEKIKKYVKKLE
jgi:hypothetical protein